MFSLKNEEKKVKITLYTILALFFIICLYAVLAYGDSCLLGSIEKADNDDVKYIRSAWTFLDTGRLTYHDINEPTVYIMPGITFVLAFFMTIFGKAAGIVAFRVFQVILQTLSMYLLFLIGRKVFNSRVALGACVIDLFSVAEYYAATLILTEAIFKFLLLFLLYLSISAIEERKAQYYILGGFIWGIACLFRPTIAAYPAVILAMWLIKKYKFRDMAKFTVMALLGFTVIMSPWWIRNYTVFDKFIPLTFSSGNPFLQGTYLNYDQTKDYTPYKIGQTAWETNQNEMNTGIYRLKTYGKEHPFQYVMWYTLGKSWHFWNSPFYWKEILGVSCIRAGTFHWLVLITAALGAVLLFKKRKKSSLPFILFFVIGYFNLIYLPYYTFSRYAFPVMPLAGILSAYLLDSTIKIWKGAGYGQLQNTDSR